MIIFCLILGSCLASHALVTAQRRDSSDNSIFSRCDSCFFPLTLLDQVPIFSFLYKKGKCSFCHENISYLCLLSEFAGAFFFIRCNPSSYLGILEIIFLYFLFLISLEDYLYQNFYIKWLIPPFFISIISQNAAYHSFSQCDWLVLFVLSSLFIILNFRNKLGFGDSCFFICLFLYKGLLFTNQSLLIGCLLFIILNIKKNTPHPLLPYWSFGIICQTLLG